ncbi:Mo25-like family protein [Cavenderia fasciculata]|uniref:Mo25-like family protein n=1 Tax=Cavenderia fasciculata TaxID=261658 RepID=F4PNX8_CACFS|nr:Mo25-like family protein [Cavenderia fasciculata]EGG23181.1 Mo25-like family protein [Cavenderia fasciculata]|eukprot:XP_004361032.1 Mo25-like family protein [Cavenderia fasciculata]
MNIFFNKKQKTPADLAKSTKESLVSIEKSGPNSKTSEKALEEISKNLLEMKKILYGDGEHEPNQELGGQLANELCATDALHMLIRDLSKLEFEAKKDFAQIFNNLLRLKVNSRSILVEHISKNTDILVLLVKGYEQQDIALNCGTMLRECIKHENLAKELLHSQNFWEFFNYVEVSNFDVASDTFATFKELLTKHKGLSAEFLEKNYDLVFEKYTTLLNSSNYVTRRQSIKLLGELLLDRSNFNIMTKYISSAANLKLMMILLRDKSKSIQYEAFHVFKVFVANPNKTKPILEILTKNKDKLIIFLSQFHTDKEEDQFNDEKNFLLKQIQAIPTD